MYGQGRKKRRFQEEKKHISFCDGRRNQGEEGATIWVVENVPQNDQNEPLPANHLDLIIFVS